MRPLWARLIPQPRTGQKFCPDRHRGAWKLSGQTEGYVVPSGLLLNRIVVDDLLARWTGVDEAGLARRGDHAPHRLASLALPGR